MSNVSNMKCVGVYSQPIGSIQKWRDRGVNVMMGLDLQGGAVTKAQYKAELTRLKMPYYDIVTSADDVETIAKDPFCIGFMLEDEPDRRLLFGNFDAYRKAMGLVPPNKTEADRLWAIIQNYLSDAKALTDRIRKTGKPSFVNFAGTTAGAAYPYYDGTCHKWVLPLVDEVSMDFYPENINTVRQDAPVIGVILDLIAKWTTELKLPAKPMWTCLECSNLANVGAVGRAPTVDEMQAQWDICEVRKLKGIVWFPQRVAYGNFSYDAVVEPQLSKLVSLSKSVTGGVVTPPVVVPPVVIPPQPVSDISALEAAVKSLDSRCVDLLAKYDGALQRLKALEDAPKVTGVQLTYNK